MSAARISTKSGMFLHPSEIALSSSGLIDPNKDVTMYLTLLDSDDIAQVVLTVATPNALCGILRSHKDVVAVRQHLLGSMDARREIEAFVRERLVDLKPKIYFPHEAAFCALAVALEPLSMPAAEDLLSELAALQIAEMPISSRVAVLCLRHRREFIISNTVRVFKVESLPVPDRPSLMRRKKVPTQSTYSPNLKAA
jgi:hypothetical protein